MSAIYQELALEYILQQKKIALRVSELRKASKIADASLQRSLKIRTLLLYTMCLELRDTAEHLKFCERREKYAN